MGMGRCDWCPEPGSNRHSLRRGILSPLCLPVSPSGRMPLRWRRVPESNWDGRICNPLHNHFANPPLATDEKGKVALSLFLLIWSGRRVSNSRPIPWQGIALPTELLPHSQHCLQATGAGEESRTLDLYLGKVSLYQLSYSRFVFCLLRVLRRAAIIGSKKSLSSMLVTHALPSKARQPDLWR